LLKGVEVLEDSKILDALVCVHSDHLKSDDFVYQQVESRIEEYEGRTVYNLSTFTNPNPRNGITNIKSPSGDPERAYDLDKQIDALLRYIKEEGDIFEVEIVGGTWWGCVPHTSKRLNKVPNLKATINYDCTDSVGDYLAVLGRSYLFNGKPIPKPSKDAIRKYKEMSNK